MKVRYLYNVGYIYNNLLTASIGWVWCDNILIYPGKRTSAPVNPPSGVAASLCCSSKSRNWTQSKWKSVRQILLYLISPLSYGFVRNVWAWHGLLFLPFSRKWWKPGFSTHVCLVIRLLLQCCHFVAWRRAHQYVRCSAVFVSLDWNWLRIKRQPAAYFLVVFHTSHFHKQVPPPVLSHPSARSVFSYISSVFLSVLREPCFVFVSLRIIQICFCLFHPFFSINNSSSIIIMIYFLDPINLTQIQDF